MIYFATPDHRLKKVRSSDGTVVWDVTTGVTQPIGLQTNAVLSGSVVALARVDIVAYDTATGSRRWTYMPADKEETGDHALTANDSTIFAGGLNGRVHAVNAGTGAVRWVVDISGGEARVAAFNPVVSGDLVFVCSKTGDAIPPRGKLWALDAATGTVRWTHDFVAQVPGLGTSCWGSAALWQALVIQAQQDGRVFAFDRATGQVHWTAPMIHDPSTAGNDRRWAAIGGDVVLVTSQVLGGSIVAYEAATGAERWRRTDYGGSFFVPALDASVAYVDHGWVFASYDLSTGAVRWATPRTFSDPATLYKGTPIIGDDRIFVAGRDGSYALKR